MPRSHQIHISMTEVPHFCRLVDFVAAVERYADEECDMTLRSMVEELRADLASPWEDES